MAKTIKIGQASISEHGTTNGEAGDSTSKEVYIIDNYNISNIDPYIVLRPKTDNLASASVNACIAGCNNDNIGYSQAGRNTLYSLAKELNFDLSSVGLCNTDCSAFMTVCALAGGARITYGSNAPTTSNMRTRFSKSGDYKVLTDSKYTTMTDYLKAGDILVHENIHAVMVLENGSKYQSEVDELDTTFNLQTYNVLAKVSDISNTSATINIKAITQLNEAENIVSNKNWLYILEYKKLPKGTASRQNIVNNKVVLTNLTENTCYMYRIIVKDGDTTLFCSAFKTFNTLSGVTDKASTLHTEDHGYITAVYVRASDEYIPVSTYINKEYI
jgi:hypothetical protein